jgi:hypothetical protein
MVFGGGIGRFAGGKASGSEEDAASKQQPLMFNACRLVKMSDLRILDSITARHVRCGHIHTAIAYNKRK